MCNMKSDNIWTYMYKLPSHCHIPLYRNDEVEYLIDFNCSTFLAKPHKVAIPSRWICQKHASKQQVVLNMDSPRDLHTCTSCTPASRGICLR